MIFVDDSLGTYLVAASRREMLDALLDRLDGEPELWQVQMIGAACLGIGSHWRWWWRSPRNDEKPPAPYVVRGALVCVWRGGVAGVNVGRCGFRG